MICSLKGLEIVLELDFVVCNLDSMLPQHLIFQVVVDTELFCSLFQPLKLTSQLAIHNIFVWLSI